MIRQLPSTILTLLFLLLFPQWAGGSPLEPIQSVERQPNGALHVNGKPFFPLMAWLQDAREFEAFKACGINTIAGYYPGSSKTADAQEYLDLIESAGLYGIMPFHRGLKNHPALLGYIHDDEPDMPRQASRIVLKPDHKLKINRKTPLWKMFDGVTHSWSVLDPLDGASFTVTFPKALTVRRFGIWLTVSKDLSLASELQFRADGRLISTARLEGKPGRQEFFLSQPATFKELNVTVSAALSGTQAWGSIAEIEGFDDQGNNVLLSPPLVLPRASPARILANYQAIKASDPSRPVFLTLTGYFHPFFNKWPADSRQLYIEYVGATDVVGFDIYPIYGWNRPDWIHLVHEGTDILARMAAPKPIYAWIETSRGSKWISPLERQKQVLPQHIRAQVWMAICRGATAIGYFTHVWKPSYQQFGTPDVNRRAMGEINARLKRFTPVLLGPTPDNEIQISTDNGVKVDMIARRQAGKLYLFMVNYDERQLATTVKVAIEGIADGTDVVVIDENRSLKTANGGFSDSFAPLAVRAYTFRVK